MWPYTHDESNWLTVVAVLDTTQPRQVRPPSLAEMEVAARRYRARVVAGWIRGAFHGLRRMARAALYRGRKIDGTPPKNAVGAD